MVNGCSLKVGSRSSNKPARVSGSLKPQTARQNRLSGCLKAGFAVFCTICRRCSLCNQPQLAQTAGNAVFGGGGTDVAGNGFQLGRSIAHSNAETDGFEHFPIV